MTQVNGNVLEVGQHPRTDDGNLDSDPMTDAMNEGLPSSDKNTISEIIAILKGHYLLPTPISTEPPQEQTRKAETDVSVVSVST